MTGILGFAATKHVDVFGLVMFPLMFLAFGLVCLLFPRQIQRSVVDYFEQNRDRLSMKLNPFRGFVRSPSYAVMLRIMGAVAVGCAVWLFLLGVGVVGPSR